MDSPRCLCTDLACDLHPRPLAPLDIHARHEAVWRRIELSQEALDQLRSRALALSDCLTLVMEAGMPPETTRIHAIDALERHVAGLLSSIASARGAL